MSNFTDAFVVILVFALVISKAVVSPDFSKGEGRHQGEHWSVYTTEQWRRCCESMENPPLSIGNRLGPSVGLLVVQGKPSGEWSPGVEALEVPGIYAILLALEL